MQFIFDFGAVVPPDVAHTSLILIWSGNPNVTNKPQSIAIKEQFRTCEAWVEAVRHQADFFNSALNPGFKKIGDEYEPIFRIVA